MELLASKKEIIERIKVLGKYDGYIISPSHEVTSDCKEENFLIMLETLECYKIWKIKNNLKNTFYYLLTYLIFLIQQLFFSGRVSFMKVPAASSQPAKYFNLFPVL